MANWSFIAMATGTADGSATTLDCSASLDVADGDSLVGFTKWEGSSTTVAVAKTTGSPANTFTFDGGDLIDTGVGFLGSFGYLLNASADATATFRLTLGAAQTFRRVFVLQLRPTAGWTVTKYGSSGSFGSSAALASGNITTVGSEIAVVGAYGNFSANNTSNERIGGIAATEPAGSPAGNSSVWYRLMTEPLLTGQATATITAADWLCAIIALRAAAPAAGPRYILGSH